MSTPSIDTIIFDFGGVLIDWDPRYLYRKMFNGDEEAVEHFLQTVCTHEWNASFDAGKPMEEGIAEKIALFPDKAPYIRAWKDRFSETLGGPIEGTVTLLEALDQKGIPLFGLTNWSAETFPHAFRIFPFLGRFRDIVVSGAEKLAKPDPRIFELAITRSGCTPSRTLFIDDNATNVEAAKKCGLQAVRFTSPNELHQSLMAYGVL